MQKSKQSARLWILVCAMSAMLAFVAAPGQSEDENNDAGKKSVEQTDRQKAEQAAMEKAIEAARRAYEEEQKALQEKLRSDPAWQASHQQTAVIHAGPESKPVALNNFCLNLDGNLLVACGGKRVEYIQGDKPGEMQTKEIDEPAEIRVLSPGGKLLKAWSLEFKPGALCVAADGTIYVGGDGRLAKLDQQGKVLAAADSPAVVPGKPAPKKEGNGEEKKDEKPKSPGLLGALLKSLGLGGSSEPQEEVNTAVLAGRRKEITGIAVTDRDLFVVTAMRKGWGYCVWRMDRDFNEPKEIINKLSGCCGQMDIQAKDAGVWVAHNARHKVEHYDRDGKKLSDFGKTDRKNADGFGGCCEPKNLRFAQNGELLACESGPPVAVKRFTTDGKFLGVVAIPVFNSGCVRVTVDMSRDGSQVYVLNEGERAIHVLTDKRTVATHKQTATFPLLDVKKKSALHTFCLDGKGNLLVACGGQQTIYMPSKDGAVEPKLVGEPAEIRVLDPEGKLLHTWELDFTPQAINADDEGTIYVGGDGHLAKLDQNGKVLLKSDSPQMSALPPLPPMPEKKEPAAIDKAAEEARQKKIAELRVKAKEAQETYRKALQEAKPPANATPEQRAAFEAKLQEPMKKVMAAQQELREAVTSPELRAMQQRMAILQKASISAIAVSGKDVFVACPMTKGFGYAVWRTDADFGNAERIVEGLSGCCGQMDIQARDGKIYAAENARKRVICYDRNGKQLASWGKNERGGPEGFGSCCNPMNLRIGSDGNVYTSESNVGRIKRFTPEGKFLGLIGAAEIVPGCKHVAIGVNADASRVYLLDITRWQVVLLTKKEQPNSEKEAEREKLEQK